MTALGAPSCEATVSGLFARRGISPDKTSQSSWSRAPSAGRRVASGFSGFVFPGDLARPAVTLDPSRVVPDIAWPLQPSVASPPREVASEPVALGSSASAGSCATTNGCCSGNIGVGWERVGSVASLAHAAAPCTRMHLEALEQRFVAAIEELRRQQISGILDASRASEQHSSRLEVRIVEAEKRQARWERRSSELSSVAKALKDEQQAIARKTERLQEGLASMQSSIQAEDCMLLRRLQEMEEDHKEMVAETHSAAAADEEARQRLRQLEVDVQKLLTIEGECNGRGRSEARVVGLDLIRIPQASSHSVLPSDIASSASPLALTAFPHDDLRSAASMGISGSTIVRELHAVIQQELCGVHERFESLRESLDEKMIFMLREVEERLGFNDARLEQLLRDGQDCCGRVEEQELRLGVVRSKVEAYEQRLAFVSDRVDRAWRPEQREMDSVRNHVRLEDARASAFSWNGASSLHDDMSDRLINLEERAREQVALGQVLRRGLPAIQRSMVELKQVLDSVLINTQLHHAQTQARIMLSSQNQASIANSVNQCDKDESAMLSDVQRQIDDLATRVETISPRLAALELRDSGVNIVAPIVADLGEVQQRVGDLGMRLELHTSRIASLEKEHKVSSNVAQMASSESELQRRMYATALLDAHMSPTVGSEEHQIPSFVVGKEKDEVGLQKERGHASSFSMQIDDIRTWLESLIERMKALEEQQNVASRVAPMAVGLGKVYCCRDELQSDGEVLLKRIVALEEGHEALAKRHESLSIAIASLNSVQKGLDDIALRLEPLLCRVETLEGWQQKSATGAASIVACSNDMQRRIDDLAKPVGSLIEGMVALEEWQGGADSAASLVASLKNGHRRMDDLVMHLGSLPARMIALEERLADHARSASSHMSTLASLEERINHVCSMQEDQDSRVCQESHDLRGIVMRQHDEFASLISAVSAMSNATRGVQSHVADASDRSSETFTPGGAHAALGESLPQQNYRGGAEAGGGGPTSRTASSSTREDVGAEAGGGLRSARGEVGAEAGGGPGAQSAGVRWGPDSAGFGSVWAVGVGVLSDGERGAGMPLRGDPEVGGGPSRAPSIQGAARVVPSSSLSVNQRDDEEAAGAGGNGAHRGGNVRGDGGILGGDGAAGGGRSGAQRPIVPTEPIPPLSFQQSHVPAPVVSPVGMLARGSRVTIVSAEEIVDDGGHDAAAGGAASLGRVLQRSDRQGAENSESVGGDGDGGGGGSAFATSSPSSIAPVGGLMDLASLAAAAARPHVSIIRRTSSAFSSGIVESTDVARPSLSSSSSHEMITLGGVAGATNGCMASSSVCVDDVQHLEISISTEPHPPLSPASSCSHAVAAPLVDRPVCDHDEAIICPETYNGLESPVTDERRHQRIRVTVESATGLRISDTLASSMLDPYCIVEVPGTTCPRIRTEVRTDTTSPRWFHHAEILDFGVEDTLKFMVFNKDRWPKQDDLLGEASLGGAACFLPGGFVGDLPLTSTETGQCVSAFSNGEEACNSKASLRIRVVVATPDDGAHSLHSPCGPKSAPFEQPSIAVQLTRVRPQLSATRRMGEEDPLSLLGNADDSDDASDLSNHVGLVELGSVESGEEERRPTAHPSACVKGFNGSSSSVGPVEFCDAAPSLLGGRSTVTEQPHHQAQSGPKAVRSAVPDDSSESYSDLDSDSD